MTTKSKSKKLRAVGYCRTSGEGQRDNTSIPTQTESIEVTAKHNDFVFLRHYVDECKSGAKIAGRDAFQQLMRDAAAGKFDVVLVWKADRWGRSGFDILDSCNTLKRDFDVDVVDCTGAFDTRERSNTLMNFVEAGMAEVERIKIMERTQNGKIRKAKGGEPWCSTPPVGRAYNKNTGKWYVTEFGRIIKRLLERYVRGEAIKDLGKEYGLTNVRTRVSDWVRNSQLDADPYKAHIQCEELGIDELIPVPGLGPVVSSQLLAKAKNRFKHNKTFNRTDANHYPLSGFIFCADCGKALTGQTDTRKKSHYKPYSYYRHNKVTNTCSTKSMPRNQHEAAILDTLFGFLLDRPAFLEAIERSMPTGNQRKEMVAQQKQMAKALQRVNLEIKNLANAVAAGVDPAILIEKQEALLAEKESRTAALEAMEVELANLPDPLTTEIEAEMLRLKLEDEHTGKNWRKLKPAQIKQFLHSLFGDDPKREGTGIFVSKTTKGYAFTFRGRLALPTGSSSISAEALASPKMRKLIASFQDLKTARAKTRWLSLIIQSIEAGTAQNRVLKPVQSNLLWRTGFRTLPFEFELAVSAA